MVTPLEARNPKVAAAPAKNAIAKKSASRPCFSDVPSRVAHMELPGRALAMHSEWTQKHPVAPSTCPRDVRDVPSGRELGVASAEEPSPCTRSGRRITVSLRRTGPVRGSRRAFGAVTWRAIRFQKHVKRTIRQAGRLRNGAGIRAAAATASAADQTSSRPPG